MLVVQISLRNTIFLRKWAKKGTLKIKWDLWLTQPYPYFHEIAIYENKRMVDRFILTWFLSFGLHGKNLIQLHLNTIQSFMKKSKEIGLWKPQGHKSWFQY